MGFDGIDPERLQVTLAVLAELHQLDDKHPDFIAVRRATAHMFKSVKKARRAEKRDEIAEADRAVVAATATGAPDRIDDETWAVLAAHYDEPQLVELVYVVGQYTMLSMVANGLKVDVPTASGPGPDDRLEEMRETGVLKPERVMSTPQGTHVRDDAGRDVLNLCANNYLGLAQHPEVRAAAANYLWWPVLMPLASVLRVEM